MTTSSHKRSFALFVDSRWNQIWVVADLARDFLVLERVLRFVESFERCSGYQRVAPY
jgi:hypothetical protein